MKLHENLLYSFLIISAFISIFGVVTLFQINEITKPLSDEIPMSLEVLTISSELDSHAQNIRYYDEVLTQSARNFAFTQNPFWNERYDETVLLLDSEINMAIDNGDAIDKTIFNDISIANQKLIELETNAIFLVRNGEPDRAISILESTEYNNFKSIYSRGLENYADKHGITHNIALESTALVIRDLVNHTQERVNFGTGVIGLSVLIVTVVSVLFGVIISKKTTRPINQLGIAAKNIADGKLDTNIPEDGFHETKELAKSFNKMSLSLKKTIELEKKLAIAETQIKSERFAAIGEASSKIAHDLRNPLTAIKGELELFQHFNRVSLDEKSVARLKSIEESLDLMNEQINGMMNYVKANQLDIVTTTVSKLVASVVKIIIKPENIDIKLPKDDFILKCDLPKFSSVLINLINNAIQAIGPQSGTITISFEETSNHIVIDVIDSGVGMPDDSLEKIFDPLYTTKKTGTGLGLSSCKNIVEQHGGIIKAKNDPTTFTIMMPKNPEKQQEKILELR